MMVRDDVSDAFRPCSVLEKETMVMIACEHWRWNRHIVLVGARGAGAREVCVTRNCVTCLFVAVGDVTVDVEVSNAREEVVFTRQDIEMVEKTLSIGHDDGCVCKPIHGADVFFHLTVITPTTAPRLQPALSLYAPRHCFRHGVMHSHKPLYIGHRGCGMNTVVPLPAHHA